MVKPETIVLIVGVGIAGFIAYTFYKGSKSLSDFLGNFQIPSLSVPDLGAGLGAGVGALGAGITNLYNTTSKTVTDIYNYGANTLGPEPLATPGNNPGLVGVNLPGVGGVPVVQYYRSGVAAQFATDPSQLGAGGAGVDINPPYRQPVNSTGSPYTGPAAPQHPQVIPGLRVM